MQEDKKPQIEFVESSIKTLLRRMGFSFSLEFQEGGEDSWFIIKAQDAPLLIGDNGKHLSALSHVIKRIYEQKFPEIKFQFLIDINDYNKKKIEEIKDAARMHAQRVRYFKKPMEMRPMNAYERRIVHYVLQEYPDIATESTGQGLERRVVIKPLDLA
ncbi:MAG: R3H domain-containing nucleic acid-binding protein [Candidatus Giovannonibacteria bacterium]|nr:R3H domain-containing nucleic acid-binding protein [Candidatus Giovannonibacteria bacterium]